ncbi:MAG: Nif3-like dinuclear metal center hexameric protein [Epsilonproteobacteria bacterium]|nr:Nif3-like dinuclear metal center hexameric protein [Campylobacterota bacterium]
MKIAEIYDILNRVSPFELQEEWDNSGFLVGDIEKEIKNIYLSIDIDSSLIEDLESDSLLITHHPLIFKGIKKFDYSKYPVNIIKRMVEKNISLISMHTNFDKTHLNKYVVREILGYDLIVSVEDYFCTFEVNEAFEDFAKSVAKKLDLESLRVVKANNFVNTATITTGSGGELIKYIKSDCFLTGDIKYHQALEAKENKISLIDIGHFESEKYFADALFKELQNLPVKVIITNSKNPFTYIS